MSLSGLWHGASWNFVLWGFFHAAILIIYKIFCFAGRWKPKTKFGHFSSICIMFVLTVFAWGLFRTHSVSWYFSRMFSKPFGLDEQNLIPALTVITFVFLYSLPMMLSVIKDKLIAQSTIRASLACSILLFAIFVLGRDGSSDFIYFQF